MEAQAGPMGPHTIWLAGPDHKGIPMKNKTDTNTSKNTAERYKIIINFEKTIIHNLWQSANSYDQELTKQPCHTTKLLKIIIYVRYYSVIMLCRNYLITG